MNHSTIQSLAEDLFIKAAALAAQRLDGIEPPKCYITETKHLQPTFKAALIELAAAAPSRPAVSPSLRVRMPEHFCRLGSFDVSLAWPDGTAFGELKAGSKADLGHCAWDALKCATAIALGFAASAMLVAAAPRKAWTAASLGAELFHDGTFDTADLRERYGGWFGWYEKHDTQWPIRVPARVRTTALDETDFMVSDEPWVLGVARVEPADSEWFDWPRYAAAGPTG